MNVLDALPAAAAGIIPETWGKWVGARCCLHATWTTIEVLRRFGVPARPFSVHAVVANAEWLERAASENGGNPIPRSLEQRARWISHGGWAATTDAAAATFGPPLPPRTLPRWGGHLVTLSRGRLFDTAASQFIGPEVWCPPVLSADLPIGFLGGGLPLQFAVPQGAMVRFSARPGDRSWLAFLDPGPPSPVDLAVVDALAARLAALTGSRARRRARSLRTNGYSSLSST